jgi:hypothetical protein
MVNSFKYMQSSSKDVNKAYTQESKLAKSIFNDVSDPYAKKKTRSGARS